MLRKKRKLQKITLHLLYFNSKTRSKLWLAIIWAIFNDKFSTVINEEASWYRLFALGKEAEFTVSKLAARRVVKIRTSSDCQIDVLHVIIWEKGLNLWLKLCMKKFKKSRGDVCCVVGCGNNKNKSPDRIFYSFSIKKHKLEQREWIKAVRRSK